jgi:predicted PurR-regulated permease PerM
MKTPLLLDPASERDHLTSRVVAARRAWAQLGLRLRALTPRALLRFVLVALAGVVIAWLLWSSRSVLLPFEVGAALAYVIAPLVNKVSRYLPRGAAFVVVFAGACILLVAFLLYLVPALLQQVTHLGQILPRQDQIQVWIRHMHTAIAHLPRDVQNVISTGLVQANATLKSNVTTMVNQAVAFTAGVLFNIFNMLLFLLGFAIVPIWLFFVFESGAAQRAAAYRALPRAIRADVWAMLRIADRVFSSWIRGQIILSLYLGVGVFVGLHLLVLLGVKGLQDILLLAVVEAVVSPIPYIGNAVGPLPAVVMALASSWQGAVAVLALYVILANVHDNILSPKIMSKQLNIDPAILMPLMIVLGRFGLPWLILAGPIAAVSRDLFQYVYRRAGEPPWPAGRLPGDEGERTTAPLCPAEVAQHGAQPTVVHDQLAEGV